MLFIVNIFAGRHLVWTSCVEAEDEDGAHREAMRVLKRGSGIFVEHSAKHRATNTERSVSVQPISRSEGIRPANIRRSIRT